MRFRIAVALLLFFQVLPQNAGKQIAAGHSFFNVYRVNSISDAGKPTLILMSGTTMHGAKSLLPDESTVPMTYYSSQGPFGRFFRV
ncbi:hypothetical protein [Bradyrhizobium sp. USDA 4454]